jgi:hypothetical protein
MSALMSDHQFLLIDRYVRQPARHDNFRIEQSDNSWACRRDAASLLLMVSAAYEPSEPCPCAVSAAIASFLLRQYGHGARPTRTSSG